jgi:hypothetical protein
MSGETHDGQERSSRGAFWVWLCWLGAALFLYFLSTGPVAMMTGKKPAGRGSPVWSVVAVVYRPVRWAYEDTPLRKPLGVYWHLWAPEWYDSEGNPRPKYK